MDEKMRQATFKVLSDYDKNIANMGYETFIKAFEESDPDVRENIRRKLDSAMGGGVDSARFYEGMGVSGAPAQEAPQVQAPRVEATTDNTRAPSAGRRMTGDEFRRLNWMDPTTYPRDVDQSNLERNVRAQAFSHYTRTAKPIWDRMLAAAGGDEEVAYRNFVARHPSMRGVDRAAFTGNSWQKFYESLRRRGATAPAGEGERRMTGEEYRNLDWKDASTFPRGVSTMSLSRNRQRKAYEEYQKAKAAFNEVYNRLKSEGAAPVGRGNAGGILLEKATQKFREENPLWRGIDTINFIEDDFRGFLRSYGEAYGGNEDQAQRDDTVGNIFRALDESAVGQVVRALAKQIPLIGDPGALNRQVLSEFKERNPSFSGSTIDEAQAFAVENGVAPPNRDAAAVHLVQQDDQRRLMDQFDVGVSAGSDAAAEKAIRSELVTTDPTTNSATVDWNRATRGRFSSAQDLLSRGDASDVARYRNSVMLDQVILPMYNAKNNGGYNKTLDQIGDIVGSVVTSPEARQQIIDDLFTPTSIIANAATAGAGKLIQEGVALSVLAKAGRTANAAEKAAMMAWAHRLGGMATVRKIRNVLNAAKNEAVAAGKAANTALEAAALPSWKTAARYARTAQKLGISAGAGVAEGVAGDALTRVLRGEDQDLQGSLLSGAVAPVFSAGIHAGSALADVAANLHMMRTEKVSKLDGETKIREGEYRAIPRATLETYQGSANKFFRAQSGDAPVVSPRVQDRIFGKNGNESRTVEFEQIASQIEETKSKTTQTKLFNLLRGVVAPGVKVSLSSVKDLLVGISSELGHITESTLSPEEKIQAKSDAIFRRLQEYLSEYGDPAHKDPVVFNTLLRERLGDNATPGTVGYTDAVRDVTSAMSGVERASRMSAQRATKRAANDAEFVKNVRDGLVESHAEFNKNQEAAAKASKEEAARIKLARTLAKKHAPIADTDVSEALKYDASIVDEIHQWMGVHADGDVFSKELIQSVYDRTGGNVYTFRQALKDILKEYADRPESQGRHHADGEAIRSLDEMLVNEQKSKYDRFFSETGAGTVFGKRKELLTSILGDAPKELLEHLGITDFNEFISDRKRVAAFTDKHIEQALKYMENGPHREAFQDFISSEVQRAIDSGEYAVSPEDLAMSDQERYINATEMYRTIIGEKAKKLVEMIEPKKDEDLDPSGKPKPVPLDPAKALEVANKAAEESLAAKMKDIEQYMDAGLYADAKAHLQKIHTFTSKGAAPEVRTRLTERARAFKAAKDKIIKDAAKAEAEAAKLKAKAAKAAKANPTVTNGNGKPASPAEAKAKVQAMAKSFEELLFIDPDKARTQLDQLAGSDHLKEVYAKDPKGAEAYIEGMRSRLESASNPLVEEIVDGVERGTVFEATGDMLRNSKGEPRSLGRGEAFDRIPMLVEHVNELSAARGSGVTAKIVPVLVREAGKRDSYRNAVVFDSAEGAKPMSSEGLTLLYNHLQRLLRASGGKTISADNMNAAAVFINSDGERIYINSGDNATGARLAKAEMSEGAANQFAQESAAKGSTGGESSDVLKTAAKIDKVNEADIAHRAPEEIRYPELVRGDMDIAEQTQSVFHDKFSAMEASGGAVAAKAASLRNGLDAVSDIIMWRDSTVNASPKDVADAVDFIIKHNLNLNDPAAAKAVASLGEILKSYKRSSNGIGGSKVNAAPAMSALALLAATDPGTAHTFTSALHSAIQMSGISPTIGAFAASAGGLMAFAKQINVFARIPDKAISPLLGSVLTLSSLLDHTMRRVEHVTRNKFKYTSDAARDAAAKAASEAVRALSNRVHRFSDAVMRDTNELWQTIFDALDRYGEAKYRTDAAAKLNLRRGAEGKSIDPKYASDSAFMGLIRAYREVTTKTGRMISDVDPNFDSLIGADGYSNYVPRILKKMEKDLPVSGMTFEQLANSDHYLAEAARNFYDAISACFSFDGEKVDYDYTEMARQGARFFTRTSNGVKDLKNLANATSQEALDAALQQVTMNYMDSIQKGREGSVSLPEEGVDGFPIDASVRHERLYPNLGEKYYESDPLELIGRTIESATTLHHRSREFGKSMRDVTNAINDALAGQSIDDVGSLKEQIAGHMKSLLIPNRSSQNKIIDSLMAFIRTLWLDHSPGAAALANIVPMAASILSGPLYTVKYAKNMIRTTLKSSAKSYNRMTGLYNLPGHTKGHTRLHVDSSYKYGTSDVVGNMRRVSEGASVYQKATNTSDYTASRAAGDELLAILRSDSRFEKARRKLEGMYSDAELETMRSLARDKREPKREELFKTYAGRWAAMRRARVTGISSKLHRIGMLQNGTEGFRFLATPAQLASEHAYDVLVDGGSKMPYVALGLMALGGAALYRRSDEEDIAIASSVASGIGGIARLIPYLAARHTSSTAEERDRARTPTSIGSEAMLRAVAAPLNENSLTLAERAKILGAAGVSATAPFGHLLPDWVIKQNAGGGSTTIDMLGQIVEGAKTPGGVHLASAANLPAARFMFPTAIPEARNTMNDDVIQARIETMMKNIRSGNLVQQKIGDAKRKTLMPDQ